MLPIAAEELIPHRLPMRLVDRLLEFDAKKGVVEARISVDCPFVRADGQLEDVALIELLAQAFATVKGYADRLEGRPVSRGFLVGIKKFVRFQSVQAGNILKITVCPLVEIDDFAVSEGEIWCGDQLITQGEIKVWVH